MKFIPITNSNGLTYWINPERIDFITELKDEPVQEMHFGKEKVTIGTAEANKVYYALGIRIPPPPSSGPGAPFDPGY